MADNQMGIGGAMGMGVAQGAASGLAGGLIDQIFGKRNDKRAVSQHRKFTDINSQANKDLAMFGHSLQKEMYDYTTDIEGIAKKYEEAGLNPIAMMGGTSGQMGQSVSSGGGSSSASAGNANPIDMGMGMQLAMMEAQKDKIKAETEELRAKTGNIGQDTELKKSNIEKITQEIGNAKIAREGMIIQNDLERVNYRIASETADSAIEIAIKNLEYMAKNIEQIGINNEITIENKEAIKESILLQNEETAVKILHENAKIGLTNEQATSLVQGRTVEIQRMINENKKITQEDRKIQISKLEHDLKVSQPGIGQATGRIATGIIDYLIDASQIANKAVGGKLGTGKTYMETK